MKKRSKAKRPAAASQRRPRRHVEISAVTESRVHDSTARRAECPIYQGEGMLQMLDGHDQGGLSQAKAQWLFGEWSVLAELNIQTLRNNPERDRFALLAASAHQQMGDHDKARQYTQMALRWGCPPRLVAQILIAGVHNTLGRAAALAQNDLRTVRHFREAVAIASSPREAELLSHARAVREMAKLGLLPQAASLVDQELGKTRILSERPEQTQARIRVLETEVELLQQELSLAQQREQLFRTDARVEPESPKPNRAGWLEMLKKKSVSQLGQDLWVLEQTDYKRGGFFVEFGATDGVLLSNTWLLEKEFGWQGICAEPNPKFFWRLKKNRNCTVSDACIGSETGNEVDFIFADVFGGIAEYADSDMHADKRMAYDTMGRKTKLTTISLHDFLKKHNAPCDIDYLSIDTEGSEFDILAAFPFLEWNIRLLSVEHNFTAQRQLIRDLLLSHGYACTEHEWEDWYILNRHPRR